MHTQRIGIIIASVAGIISWFLPFVALMFVRQSMMESGEIKGYIVIIAFITCLVFALLGDKKTPLKGSLLAGAIIPGVIPALILIFMMISVLSGDFISMAINFEIGYFMMLLSSTVIFILGLALQETCPAITTIPQENSSKALNCPICKRQLHDDYAWICKECANV